jgi:hypothetical protein
MENFELHTAFWVLLTVVTLGASVQAVATFLNAVRLRNIRMSWKAGKLKGYPLFATIFLMVTIFMTGIAAFQNSTAELAAASFYMVLALAWFTTSYLTSKRFITDYGIVKNVNEPSQTIAWHQIRDFVEHESEEGIRFTFIYSSEPGTDRFKHIVQLELVVPFRNIYNFRKLISHKLGRRISCYTTETVRVEQFE